MSNLTADATVRSRTRGAQSYKVADAVQLYARSLVALGTGYARKWADTAGFVFLGMATRQQLGATSSSPVPEVSVDESGPILDQVAVTGVSAITDVGAKVFCGTDNIADLTLTPTTNVKAFGEIVRWYSSTLCDVRLYTPDEYANQGIVSDITALTDSSGGAAADGTIGAVTAPTALTDNGGGTADGTVQAMADPADTPADADALRDDLVANFCLGVRNNFKEFTARQTENRTAIIALTDAVKELATKVNEILTDLNQQ